MAKAPTSNSPPGSTRPYEVSDAVQYYDAHAEEIALRYEFVASEKILSWLTDLLPSPPAIVLDVGAGTGRDAAWLAAKGFDVVAVEPSTAMRNKAELLHPSALIRWLDDALPGLDGTFRLGLSFDVILLGGVWMHVLPKDRERAFRKLVTLLKPGGVIAITLRRPIRTASCMRFRGAKSKNSHAITAPLLREKLKVMTSAAVVTSGGSASRCDYRMMEPGHSRSFDTSS